MEQKVDELAPASDVIDGRCYCPRPTERQQTFLDTWKTREVFYGGAAGGGKSAALLMGALEYVNVAGYAALILRKDLRRLELSGGLIPRSHEWFAGSDAHWVAERRQWVFPIENQRPATITFGYLSGPNDKYRYASSEFQYIAFDELTEFQEEDYLFMFSRLRKSTSLSAALRMRSASNPGGVGHAWVRERFIPERGEQAYLAGEAVHKRGRIFVPARIEDNPHLDAAEYRESLVHLPPVARERLLHGDWSVAENGVFKAEQLRYYVETAELMELLDARGASFQQVSEGSCHRLLTIDPAGTSADRALEVRGRGPSYSVLQIWDRPPRELSRFLVLRHQERRRVEYAELRELVVSVARQWRPDRIGVEDEKLGRALVSDLKNVLPIECVPTQNRDKKTRACALSLKFGRGEIFLPKLETTWRPGFEAELLAWTGDEREVSDQIDAAAYAAILVEDGLPHAIRLGPLVWRG